jgi:hypothetical protein
MFIKMRSDVAFSLRRLSGMSRARLEALGLVLISRSSFRLRDADQKVALTLTISIAVTQRRARMGAFVRSLESGLLQNRYSAAGR